MKISALSLTVALGLFIPSEGGSFSRDVMGLRKPSSVEPGLDDKLRAKAIPLEEYKKNVNAKGYQLGGDDGARKLANDGNDQVYENEDDYYVNEYNMVDFTGYSFKYAKCQPVQRFSQDAIEAGEYSPMVINDIVVLRLCDSMYCSDNRAYGCNSDFVEYAIELTDYVRIMLRHEMDKKEQLCNWCDSCLNGKQGRRRDSMRYYYSYDENGNLVVNEEYVDDDDFWSNLDCTDYQQYCYDDYGNSVCENDDDNYMTAENYLDIIDCSQVNGGYFLRPRCDASSNTLSMGVFHDKFCTHYAGNEVSIEYFNLGINQTYFDEFGADAGCQDCSISYYPPNLKSNSNLCNRLDIESARCTSGTSNEMLVQNTSSSSNAIQCSFMDGIRYGTYDEDGNLYAGSVFGIRRVTTGQKFLLGLSMLICGALAVYSCYLHHAITNLLIKSLSHTDLLPPTKYRRRSNSSGNKKRGVRRFRRPTKGRDDKDEEKPTMKSNEATIA